MYDSLSANGDRPVAVYYFPVEIEVRSVPVVELREVPVYVQDDTQQLIDGSVSRLCRRLGARLT